MSSTGKTRLDRNRRASGQHPQRQEFRVDAAGLAPKASARLRATGLEMHSVLPFTGESQAADRCAGTLGQIADAINLIRQLVAAFWAHPGDRRSPWRWTIPRPRARAGPGNTAEARVRAMPKEGAGLTKTDVADLRGAEGRARMLRPAAGVRARSGGGVSWGRLNAREEAAANDLRLSVHEGDSGMIVIELDGELDLCSAPALTAAVQALQIPSTPPGSLVVLDMSGVSFCDVTGLNAMVRCARMLAGRRARLSLAAPPHPVTKLLSISRLDRYFEVFPSPPAAGGPTVRPARHGAA